jgi:secreted PhoX family phosphatase
MADDGRAGHGRGAQRGSGSTPARSGGAIARLSRRGLLRRSLWAGGGLIGASTLSALAAHRSWAQSAQPAPPDAGGYGPLAARADQDGRRVLGLPEGFSYVTFSRTGEALADGTRVPCRHDGMASFRGPSGAVRLIRNHELRSPAGARTGAVEVPVELCYDAKAGGGCFTLDFDPEKRVLVRQFASLGGTQTNCAGGFAWRSAGWLSCEESVVGLSEGFGKPHGYCFLVPADAEGPVRAEPLRALGRFVHEAALAADSGEVYLTEDARDSSGLYRFVPQQPGQLDAGSLQMLGVAGQPQAELIRGQKAGAALPVRWVPVADPDPYLENGAPSCFAQGRAQGGAAFNRLEGIFRGREDDSIYFASTSGGQGFGQLWRYRPGGAGSGEGAGKTGDGELSLVYESPASGALDSPDNLCVSPRGVLLCCEDDASNAERPHPLAGDGSKRNRLVGIAPGGEPFEFAVNLLNRSELAGVCFSPDGEFLFVNLYGDDAEGSGMTCAIWGPWTRGAL